MLELLAFTGHVVAGEQARRVVAPPYDALSPAARAALAATDPASYLGALPPGAPDDGGRLDAALARCRTHLDQLFADGRYRQLPGPALGVLVLGSGDSRSVAIVGDVPVAAFAALDDPRPFVDDDGLVRPHELVRPDRVDELTRYLDVVGVASSPVALTHRPDPAVTAATAAVRTGPPDLAYRAEDDVDVALWCVTEPAVQARLVRAVAGAGPVSLVDGHHRGAAAARFAAATGAGVDDPAGRVLCAVLPSDHLTVQAFHRRVDGVLPGTDSAAAAVAEGPAGPESDGPAERADARPDEARVAALLERLAGAGVEVRPLSAAAAPSGPHRVTLTAGGRWWELDVRRLVRDDDPVAALDVTLVDRDLLPRLAEAAGATGPPPGTTGSLPGATGSLPGAAGQLTVTPVAAPLGLEALVAPGAVGVALHPPTVATVLDIAAAGRTLPPKTTYVTPKLRSGLVVTPRPAPAGR